MGSLTIYIENPFIPTFVHKWTCVNMCSNFVHFWSKFIDEVQRLFEILEIQINQSPRYFVIKVFNFIDCVVQKRSILASICLFKLHTFCRLCKNLPSRARLESTKKGAMTLETSPKSFTNTIHVTSVHGVKIILKKVGSKKKKMIFVLLEFYRIEQQTNYFYKTCHEKFLHQIVIYRKCASSRGINEYDIYHLLISTCLVN